MLLLVYSHIINQKLLWKNTVVNTLLATPGSAYGQVQNEVVRLIVRPDIHTSMLVVESKVLVLIKEKVNSLRSPLNGVHME